MGVAEDEERELRAPGECMKPSEVMQALYDKLQAAPHVTCSWLLPKFRDGRHLGRADGLGSILMLKSGFTILPAALLLVQGAPAADTSGPGALAMAGVVALHETGLSTHKKRVLDKLFAGHHAFYPVGQKIIVKAHKIECRQSNVAINERSCALTFGTHNVNLTGRRSHEIFATLIEAGVPSDGAAGSVFERLTALTCTIDPNEVNQNAGGGASCTFSPGP
jgi:hypothetical protein